MQSLIQRWVFCVDVNLTIREFEALAGFLIEYNIQGDLLAVLTGEEWVLHHFLPIGSLRRILLHSLAQELEAGEADLDVLGPRPGTLLDFSVEQLEGHLI